MPETSIREFLDQRSDPPVRGFLHIPENANGNGLILTHGAGANAQAPLLRALAEAFAAAGFTVLRCDLPFRQVRHFGPPGPGDAARDRAGLKNALAALKANLGGDFDSPATASAPSAGTTFLPGKSGEVPPIGTNASGRLYLAGHSYGGRQASILCAEEPNLTDGLLLLSYPLHPPRRPEQQRTQHLPDLRTPTLFVHGTRDPFGTLAELERAIKMIPAKTRLIPVEGAGHDLGFKGKARNKELPAQVLEAFRTFLE